LHLANPSNVVLFAATFPTATQLITNEYAYRNPTRPDAVSSPDWIVTSGSLFGRDGTGWTGPIDRITPGPASDPHTDSAVFRLITRRDDFADVHVQFRLSIVEVTTTSQTPRMNWDGVHIWVRYQNETSSYAVSVARRDGIVLIKKKCAGGPTNGGRYYTLSHEVTGHPIPLNQWRYVGATVTDLANGGVRITMLINGHFVVGATDRGTGCAPIRAAGAVGIRGDNTEFSFAAFTVSDIGPTAAQTPAPSPAASAVPTAPVPEPAAGLSR
jgi:hypothetical protein